MSKLLLSNTEQDVLLESPLHYFKDKASSNSDAVGEQKEGGIVVKESPLLGHLVLRGDGEDASFVSATNRILGVSLPVEPCTCNENENTAIYWLGPDEWLLLVEFNQVNAIETQLRQAVTAHIAIVDVSGGQTLINLSGIDVSTVLQKSSGYDFHPLNFGVGRCVQTTFAKATAMVSKREDGSFDLVIRRSFADYIALWLLDAGKEFSCRIQLS